MAESTHGWRAYVNYDAPTGNSELFIWNVLPDGRREWVIAAENGLLQVYRPAPGEDYRSHPLLTVMNDQEDLLAAIHAALGKSLGVPDEQRALEARVHEASGARDLAKGYADRMLGILERKVLG